ncbi:hypothetical protein THAOC_14309 [Thalassiosira oceanica]|uniref:Uncharacterized protein n=1 Tax=Thalassiosira oceanica TaxID=159749 RepID=K0SHR0_THAOC|nr:hypothetical protein THAOC_14309 [Thalassiosira oceanica]|eukprot:EJK64905.1 hypothetical protein THAOC_14309 [Thalassiosira oceanica]
MCCMNKVCTGCEFEAQKRGMWDCPFCRAPRSDESQILAMIRKRVVAGDPIAICSLGNQYRFGRNGLEENITRAVELYERAAELGVKEAHNMLGGLYATGYKVEKDMANAFRHFEAAATCGLASARYNLGSMEYNDGNYDLALQNYLISAKLGDDPSLNCIKKMFMAGLATKDDYAAALRGYQIAIQEMSSPDRDQAGECTQLSKQTAHL